MNFRYNCLAITLGAAFVIAPPSFAQDVPKVLRLEEKLQIGSYLVVGEAEMVALPDLDVVWRGRIDSGANTTSIYAKDVEEFERDGAKWVRFVARNDELDASVEMEKPLSRYVRIRGEEGESTRRPVIRMEVAIGGVSRLIEVNLNDRENYDFPVLIGRNYLEGITLIDVSRTYLHGSPDEER